MAKAAATRAPRAKADASRPSNKKDATLVEAQRDTDHARKGGRRKQANADTLINDQVTKCLRDIVAALSEEEQRAVRVDGLTLAERIEKDKRLALSDKASAPPFGKHYFDSLRAQYSAARADTSALEPKSDDCPIGERLIAVVHAPRSHGGSKQLLLQYMQTVAVEPNQSEICGLFAHGLELKPHLGGGHLLALMGLCDLVKKFK